MFQLNENPEGVETDFLGVQLNASLNQLMKAFGPSLPPSECGKIRYSWEFTDSNGEPFTIYGWKTGVLRQFPLIDWNIATKKSGQAIERCEQFKTWAIGEILNASKAPAKPAKPPAKRTCKALPKAHLVEIVDRIAEILWEDPEEDWSDPEVINAIAQNLERAGMKPPRAYGKRG